MSLIPQFTKEIKLSQRATDPLGLSRVSEYIVNQLLPGITTLTNRGRNFSFYCWSLKIVNESKPLNRMEFYKRLARVEAAYAIGGYLDKMKYAPDSKGPTGQLKARNRVNNTEGERINLNFSVLNKVGGGFQQYFRTAMSDLGLVIRMQRTDILTESGKKIAEIFHENVKNTKYVKEFLLKEEVSKDVLLEFGTKCSYRRLKDFDKERNALIELFFTKNQNVSEVQDSRKKSMLMELDLFKRFTEYGIDFAEDDFRDIIYYKSFKNKDKIEKYDDPYFLDIIKPWKFYEFQEYLTSVLETILNVFLITLKDKEGGMTRQQFLEKFNNIGDLIGIRLNQNVKDKKIKEIIEIIQKFVGSEKGLTKENSEMFDVACNLGHSLSEVSLNNLIQKNYDSKKYDQVLADCILLFLVMLIRYYQNINAYDESTMWIYEREVSERSILSLYQDLKININSLSAEGLFEFLLSRIIEQHNIIAYDKLLYDNDAFGFQEQGNIFFFKREYPPALRSNRFDSLRNVFEDIGLIEFKDEKDQITELGIKTLEEYKDGK